jgi:hypothetical protein
MAEMCQDFVKGIDVKKTRCMIMHLVVDQAGQA